MHFQKTESTSVYYLGNCFDIFQKKPSKFAYKSAPLCSYAEFTNDEGCAHEGRAHEGSALAMLAVKFITVKP